MSKNTDTQALYHILNGCLPYEYDERLTTNKDAIILSKEDSDNTASVSIDDNDDIVIAMGHDDPNRGYFVEYEIIHESTEDEQIPLDSILDDIKHHL